MLIHFSTCIKLNFFFQLYTKKLFQITLLPHIEAKLATRNLHKITIGTQRVNSLNKLLRILFRVLSLKGIIKKNDSLDEI